MNLENVMENSLLIFLKKFELGKLYNDVKEYVQDLPTDTFGKISKNKAIWHFVEFANRLKSWTKFRRYIFTRFQVTGIHQPHYVQVLLALTKWLVVKAAEIHTYKITLATDTKIIGQILFLQIIPIFHPLF